MAPPGVYVVAVAPAISENPVDDEVIDDCHWEVILPDPLAALVDVKPVGVKLPQLFWSLPITPGFITETVMEDVLMQPVVVTVPVTVYMVVVVKGPAIIVAVLVADKLDPGDHK